MNVTLVPEQIVVEDAPTLTLTGKFVLTVITRAFDEVGLPVAQVAFDVNTTETISLLAKVKLVYVGLFVPTLIPFNFH